MTLHSYTDVWTCFDSRHQEQSLYPDIWTSPATSKCRRRLDLPKLSSSQIYIRGTNGASVRRLR